MTRKASNSDIEHFYRSIAEDNKDFFEEFLNKFSFKSLDQQFSKRHNASILQKICQNDAQKCLSLILDSNSEDKKVCYWIL